MAAQVILALVSFLSLAAALGLFVAEAMSQSRNPRTRTCLALLAIGLALAACASPALATPDEGLVKTAVAQTLAAQPTATEAITSEPSSTPTPVLTRTPLPISTPTPEPTATPGFVKWTSAQVVDAFLAAGLEASSPRPMTKDDYGFAPMIAIEGARFLITSLCSDCGGRILNFASQEDLEKTRAYYVEMGKESAAFFSWTFAKDNILVQINGDLPEENARQYEAALVTIH